MLIRIKKNNKWGYFNTENDYNILCEYSNASKFTNGVAIVSIDENYGIIDTIGNQLVPIRFTEITLEENGLYKVYKNHFFCYYNSLGEIVNTIGHPLDSSIQQFSLAQEIAKDIFQVMTEDENYCIVNGQKTIIKKDFYEEVSFCSDKLIQLGNTLYDLSGNTIISSIWQVTIVTQQYFIVSAGNWNDKRYGIIDKQGSILLQLNYSKIEYQKGNIFILTFKTITGENKILSFDAGKQTFLIEDNNETIEVPNIVDWCDSFSNGFAIVSKNNLYGYINRDNIICIDCCFNQAKRHNGNNGVVEKDSKWFLTDNKGYIISEGYDSIDEANNNYYIVRNRSNFGLVNSTGSIVINTKYSGIKVLADDLFEVSTLESDAIGLLDSQNRFIIYSNNKEIHLPPKYEWVDNFSEGLARVKDLNGYYGFIDSTGKEIIECKHIGVVSSFKNGIFTKTHTVVDHDTNRAFWIPRPKINLSSCINKDDEFVVKEYNQFVTIKGDFQFVSDLNDGSAFFYDGKHFGIVNDCGEILNEPIYDSILYLDYGYYKVKKNKLWGIVSSKGDCISECKYVDIKLEGQFFKVKSQYNDNYFNINTCGFIVTKDDKCDIFLPQIYDYVCNFKDGFAKIQIEKNWGVINRLGELVVPCIYSSIGSIYNNHFFCTKDNKQYLVSSKGEEIALSDCTEATYYNDDCIVVGKTFPNKDHNNYHIINKKGEYIAACYCKSIGPFVDGVAITEDGYNYNYKLGAINERGETIIENKCISLIYNSYNKTFNVVFDDSPIINGRREHLIININKEIVVFNGDKSYIIPSVYKIGRNFHDGLAAVAIEKEKHQDNNSLLYRNPYFFRDKKKNEVKYAYGFININSKLVIECKFDYATDFKDKVSIVSIEGKKGIIDLNGNFIIEPIYEDIEFTSTNLYRVKENEKWGIIDINSSYVIPADYLAMGNISEGLVAVKRLTTDSTNNHKKRRKGVYFDERYRENIRRKARESLWEYIDLNNNQVIPPSFIDASDFHEGLAAVHDDKGWRYINSKGETIIEGHFISAESFNNNQAVITLESDDKKLKYAISKTGHFIINSKICPSLKTSDIYFIGEYKENVAKIHTKNGWGFISRDGDILFDDFAFEVSDLNNGEFQSGHGSLFCKPSYNLNKNAIIYSKGEIIVFPSLFKTAMQSGDSFFLVTNGFGGIGESAIVDRQFRIIVPFTCDEIHHEVLNENSNEYEKLDYFLCTDRYDSKCGRYYDAEGDYVIPVNNRLIKTKQSYVFKGYFSEGLGAVLKNDLWGFIDETGNEVIPCIYNNVEDFKDGLCHVTINKTKGVINKQGDFVVLPGDYYSIDCYSYNKKAILTHRTFGEWKTYDNGYDIEDRWVGEKREINKNNEILIKMYNEFICIPKEYDWCDDCFSNGFISVYKDGKWGVLNSNLELVIDCLYDERIIFEEGLAITRKGNTKCVINPLGEIVLSGDYEKIKCYPSFNIIICYYTNKNIDVFSCFGRLILSADSSIFDVKNSNSNENMSLELVPIDNNFLKFALPIKDRYNRLDYKWGLCDMNGKIIIDNKYQDITYGGTGLFAVAIYKYRPNLLWGYIDFNDNIIIDFKYIKVTPFISGLAKVKKEKSKWGLIGINGKELTNFSYDRLLDTEDGMITAIVHDSSGIHENKINKDGDIQFDYSEYEGIGSNGYYINYSTCLNNYDWVSEIIQGHCIVSKGDLKGIIDKSGIITFPLTKFIGVRLCIDYDNNHIGNLVFKKGNKIKEINGNGQIESFINDKKVYLPVGVFWCDEWIDGCLIVENNHRFGLLDSELKFVLEMSFFHIQHIGDNKVFCIKLENKTRTYHIYDVNEKKMIDLDYHSCSDFENGYSIVSILEEDKLLYGVIDSCNIIIVPCVYDNILLIKDEIVFKKNYNFYDDYESYSRYDSLMDALDGEPDAYWNIF